MSGKKELFQRGDIWWYRFTHPRTGKQVRGSTGKTEKSEAQQVLDKTKADVWLVITVGTEKPPRLWGEAAIRWLEEAEKRSIETDASRLSVLNEVMVNTVLTDITGDYVREEIIKGHLEKRNLKPATINRYILLMQSILNKSFKMWRWIDQVPYLPRPGKSKEGKRKAWVTPDQFKRIHAQLSEHFGDVALLALATGLRYSNVAKLEWRWIDVAKNCIIVPKESFKGKRDHAVPINETARKVLAKYLGKHPERVFVCSKTNLPFGRLNQRYWHLAVDRAGVNAELRAAGLLGLNERFVFHGLRHSFATWLIRTGISADIVEELGGWAPDSSRMVFTYAHAAGVGRLLPYSQRMDEILGAKTKEFSTVLAHDTWRNLAQNDLSH
jgi:integrase